MKIFALIAHYTPVQAVVMAYLSVASPEAFCWVGLIRLQNWVHNPSACQKGC